MSESQALEWHPQRGALINELHSRPFRAINSGTSITHLALLSDESIKEAQAQHLQLLIEELGTDHSVSSGALNSFSIGREVLMCAWSATLSLRVLHLPMAHSRRWSSLSIRPP